MNSPPAINVTPPMPHAPSTTWPAASFANGTSGSRFCIGRSPVISGTVPTRISGISAATPRIVWMRAAFRMPRCWMANVIRRTAAPRMNVELMRRLRPDRSQSRLQSVICQVLIAASGGNMTERMYPAASPEPMASTGDHANQLHHTDNGANSFE